MSKCKRGIVAEVWREDGLRGARFVKGRRVVEWAEMTEQERFDAVHNLLETGLFFNKFLERKVVEG